MSCYQLDARRLLCVRCQYVLQDKVKQLSLGGCVNRYPY